ncbi:MULTISPECIES: AraC family transcriptional regulator [unclassified Curtobacterium]|uniref:AraC family transcriptional regulator n=1 Tax=unclassified Curtobacterium TaxID=257496 RepID=UPI0015E881F5|nr:MULTISPECIES: AraC family transcriptional regulator [unclassified Curtobacterium]
MAHPSTPTPGAAPGNTAADRTFRGEWTRYVAVPTLGVEGLHARFLTHKYERHTHRSYVFASVEAGAPITATEGASFVTPAGSAMVINPGEEHDGRPLNANGYTYRTLRVDADIVQDVARELGPMTAGAITFSQPVIHDPQVVAALRRVHRTLFDVPDDVEQEIRLVQLIELVLRNQPRVRIDPPRRSDHRATVARDLMHARFRDRITAREIADAAGLHRVRLNQVFRERYGLPLHAYLNALRLEEARRLLRVGWGAAEAAVAAGFSDQSHLSRRFKGSYGITPGQFVAAHASSVQDER